jgi:hypothetical protein
MGRKAVLKLNVGDNIAVDLVYSPNAPRHLFPS